MTRALLPALLALAACRNTPPPPPPPSRLVDAGAPVTDTGVRPADVATATVDAPAPTPALPSPVAQIALGHGRACAARVDGRVVCWGSGEVAMDYGDAGTPIAAPTLVAGIDDATQVAGDAGSWCARRRDGEVRCWDEHLRAGPAVATGVAEVTPGCVRYADGRVACWTGDGPARSLTPVAGLAAVRALGHGNGPCVVHADGAASCWGSNNNHQLADGTTVDREAPVRIPGLARVDEIGVSYSMPACARAGGRVWCWGGELPPGLRPTPFRGVSGATQLAVGEYHTCVLIAGGRVACWGGNSSGQLGVSAEARGESARPVVVPGVRDAVEVRVGGGEPCGGCGSTCVRDRAGEVLCWGQINGQSRPTRVDLAAARVVTGSAPPR